MVILILSVLARIISNSYLNVYQKLLTSNGEHSSVVNFYTYLGLTAIGLFICPNPVFTTEALPSIISMGFLGAVGNYFIIKALSEGELSTLAPINSYKPIIALIISFFILKEIPGIFQFAGILLIIAGTFILSKSKIFYSKSTIYRIIALALLGTEAVFIKKVIQLTNINSAFLYWVITGLIFATFFAIISKHKIKISKNNIKTQCCLIFAVTIMQYMTNYVFSIINVAYALALFQLSTVVSVFLGVNIFNEKDLKRKIIASIIMLTGACIIILQ